MAAINKKIVAFRLLSNEAPAPLPDINPLDLRIERRPEGELEAISEKSFYWTQEGKKTIYFLISFMPVVGRIENQKIVVERPIEFFLPIGQANEDHQWVTATMRSLSLAARGGYCARALQDLTQVTWDKGLVKCGTKDYGSGKAVPVQHKSEVAAIAWSIQQALFRRGFLDSEGNQVPALKLALKYERRLRAQGSNEAGDIPEVILEVVRDDSVQTDVKGALCDRCKNYSVFAEAGCQICRCCFDTKCG